MSNSREGELIQLPESSLGVLGDPSGSAGSLACRQRLQLGVSQTCCAVANCFVSIPAFVGWNQFSTCRIATVPSTGPSAPTKVDRDPGLWVKGEQKSRLHGRQVGSWYP